MSEMFELTVHPLELFIRGSIMYLGLIIVLRFLLRRDVGSLGMPDVLFVVLIADAAQNAMSGEYRSIFDGVILVGTLVFWNVTLDWLAYRNGTLRRLTEPPQLPLIKNGKWVRQNLKREWITTGEVRSKLREQGIEDLLAVESAFLEPDGELSVIRRDGENANRRSTAGPA